MPPQNKIENPNEGDKGAGKNRPVDNLTGERTVDGKAVQTAQRKNPNIRNSLTDIPNLGRTLGKSGPNAGFCITDGDKVIASKEAHGQSTESLSGVPTVIGADGKTYLQGHISNVPEVSQGVQNLNDLEAMANGIAAGVSNAARDTLGYLSKPDAVNNTLIGTGPALDTAVDYYSTTSPNKVVRDAGDALGYAAQALEQAFGHPMTPEQRGECSGAAMPYFLFGSKEPLSETKVESLGLEQKTTTELEALGIRRVENYGLKRLTKEELGIGNEVPVFEATKSMKDGTMSVSLDYIWSDTKPNMFKLFNKMAEAAKAEGAHTLRIEGVPINDRLEQVLLRRYQPTIDGLNHVITIPLDR